jgi:uncharacterized protein YerC
MRTSGDKLNKTLENQIIKTLAQTVADFHDPDEALLFVKDFFNESETETFAKRLAIAYWLKKGRSYVNIKQNLKVSSATIAEISNMMKKEGFRLAIKKTEAEEWANIWAERIKKFTKRIG